jgi:predicted ester cyclase
MRPQRFLEERILEMATFKDTREEEAYKALFKRACEEGINQRKWNVFDEVISKDAVMHEPDGDKTAQAFREWWLPLVAALPDLKIKVIEVIAEKDLSAGVFSVEGTFTKPLATPQGELKPTGKKCLHNGIRLSRMTDGKVVESWIVYDTLFVAQQTGALPAQGELPVVKPWTVKLGASTTPPAENKVKVSRAYKNWGPKTTPWGDAAGDFVLHLPVSLYPQRATTDLAGARQVMEETFALFPDSRPVPFGSAPEYMMVAEGNLVAILYTSAWAFTKPDHGLEPNGNTIRYAGLDLIRIKDGKVAEVWINFDTASMVRQMMAPPARKEKGAA